jgi:hypothetical protein
MEEDWLETVREGIETLRECFPEGAGKHNYQFGPTLSEAQRMAHEQELGISLPEDYRAFLQHIGNGGCGPGYGLIRFVPDELAEKNNLSLPFLDPETHFKNGVMNNVGMIPIGDYSEYGSWDVLAITSGESGNVWSIYDNCEGLGFPYENSGHYEDCSYYIDGVDRLLWEPRRPHRYTFKDWYLDWLTAMLNTARQRGIS